MIKPIKCPYCGSTELSFVSEIHKCIVARIFAGIALLFVAYFSIDLLLTIFTTPSEATPIGIIISILAYAVIKLIIILRESKSHVQGICQRCGEIWLLN